MSIKKFTLALFACAASSVAFGQQAKVISPEQVEASKVTATARIEMSLHNPDTRELVSAKQVVPSDFQRPVANPNGVHAVSPFPLGRASNAFTILRGEQNQVIADESLGLVGFIHRQDVTVFGGGGSASGKYRVDLSTDGGASFVNDLGPLNDVYQRPARYPNLTIANPENSSNPFDAKIIYSGATLNPAPDWDGHVVGVMDVTTSNPVTVTENYILQGVGTLIPGGLCEGLPGEFWTSEFGYIGGSVVDSFYTYKGVYNTTTQDVDWNRVDANGPDFNLSYDGTSYATTVNQEFSPDGMTGWQAFLGDIVGGHDSTFAPILRKTTDGGATWGSWMEVDLRNIPWIADSLQMVWVDSVGNPVSTGRPTTTFDFDITVDGDGNPHFFTIIGSATSTTNPVPGYSIFSGLAMFAADVYSTDGGATWDVDYISPVLSLRGEFGTDNGDGLLTMDNQPQASRSEDGDYVYYSWVDSDTFVTGLGNNVNSAPNLRIAGKRMSDGYRTCYKLITDGDILWDGRALFPAMSPVAMRKAGGSNHHLPIVMMELITNDQIQPVAFHYFGGDAVLYESDFVDPANLTPAWGQNCTVVSNELPAPASDVVLFQSFPNPNSGSATIRFELPAAQGVSLNLVNMYGQQVGVLAAGNFAAGTHNVDVNTSDLAAGVYFYNLTAGDKVFTKKMIVTK